MGTKNKAVEPIETINSVPGRFNSAYMIPAKKTPSIKVIGEQAGFFVAEDSILAAGGNVEEFLKIGIPHEQKTNETYKVKDEYGEEKVIFKYIPGVLIKQPRLLIFQCSPMLKMENKKIIGMWDSKVDVKDKYKNEKGETIDIYAARRYLIAFLGNENQPLHTLSPDTLFMLTASANFGRNFNYQYSGKWNWDLKKQEIEGFKKAVAKCFSSMFAGDLIAELPEYEYCGWVFKPKLKAELCGTTEKSFACVTTGFEIPTKDNWESLSVKEEMLPIIKEVWEQTKDFWNKSKSADLALTAPFSNTAVWAPIAPSVLAFSSASGIDIGIIEWIANNYWKSPIDSTKETNARYLNLFVMCWFAEQHGMDHDQAIARMVSFYKGNPALVDSSDAEIFQLWKQYCGIEAKALAAPKGDRNHYTKVAQNILAELGWDEVKICHFAKTNYGQIEWKTLPEDKLIKFVGDLQSQVLNDQGF